MFHKYNFFTVYRVGKFLHFVATLAFLLAVTSMFSLIKISYSNEPTNWLIWTTLFIAFAPMAILAELDAYSRFQNYKQLKDQIFFNCYQERLLKPLTRSSCQREAAVLACKELGIGDKSRRFFHDQGYRWYHIIPDFVFQHPLFFFSLYFWRTTFFTPYYHSKINYDQIDITQINFISKGLQIKTST